MTVPGPLRHSSQRVLEFEQLRELLAIYTASPLGRNRVMQLAPSQERAWIQQQQQLTEEIRGYLREGGSFDFHGLTDPGPLLSKTRIRGAALEISEIRDLVNLADRAAEWREVALHPPANIAQNWQTVHGLSQALADFTPLLRFFRNKILPDGTLDDRASPELARIRREVEKQKRSIQESLRSYLRRLRLGAQPGVGEKLDELRSDAPLAQLSRRVDRRAHDLGILVGEKSVELIVEVVAQHPDERRGLEPSWPARFAALGDQAIHQRARFGKPHERVEAID